MKVQKDFGPGRAAALALAVLLAAGCSSDAQGTARSAPSTPAPPSATASPTVKPTAVSAAPPPSSPAPAPSTAAAADPSVPPVQRNPQPLSPGQTREDLINAGVSPEDAAAWPTLPTVTAEDARRIVADSLQNSPDLLYDVFETRTEPLTSR